MKTSKKLSGLLNLLSGFTVLFSVSASGQIVDSTYNNQFNAFNKQINQEFEGFSSHNDSIFILFLQNSWKEFEGKENPIPVSPKPVNQPRYLKDGINELQQDSVSPGIMENPGNINPKENPIPEKDALDYMSLNKTFSFYGNRIELPAANTRMPALGSVTRQGIIDYFIKASRSVYLNEIAVSLKEKSDQYKLNDWGFASLLFQASKSYYYTVNEQILFSWVAMLHSGYNAKVGYSNNRIYLLIPADVQLYTVSYTVGNKDYFVLGPGSVPSETEKVYIYEADYPGNKTNFSFQITETPQFGYKETTRTLYYEKAISINLNKNLLEFYQSYPPCDLEVYFNTPISSNVLQQLDAFFLPLLKGKTESEQVAVLLYFVQRAISYKTDQEQFGKERYLFPDETLYFPAADCEDRSALFARLINRYTKLDVIGLSYPMHVSVAVNLPSCQGNDYVIFKNKRFYQCDPTYLGAECGMAMSAVSNTKPEIINYMKLTLN